MRQVFDLNISPMEQYPVIKVLTKTDMTKSLVLPRRLVEEFIVPNMPEPLRNRLTEGDGKANIWVVDDENNLEHYLTMVDRDHHYSITSWGHVRLSRELREGQEIRFAWMGGKLHFIVNPEAVLVHGEEEYFADNDDSDDPQEKANNVHDGEQGPEKGIDENIAEPPAKKMRKDLGESSIQETTCINP